MRLVVGLGNPGREYAQTRHNLGFRVCDRLAATLGTPLAREKFDSLVAEAAIAGDKVMLLEPQTFMNLSGQAVAAAVRFYRLDLAALLVVCDDFNLALGQLRFRRGGSDGGHNGLASVIECLDTEAFARLRLGVGPLDDRDPVTFCLGRFEPAELARADTMVQAAAEAVVTWLESGIDEAMNRFNTTGSPTQ